MLQEKLANERAFEARLNEFMRTELLLKKGIIADSELETRINEFNSELADIVRFKELYSAMLRETETTVKKALRGLEIKYVDQSGKTRTLDLSDPSKINPELYKKIMEEIEDKWPSVERSVADRDIARINLKNINIARNILTNFEIRHPFGSREDFGKRFIIGFYLNIIEPGREYRRDGETVSVWIREARERAARINYRNDIEALQERIEKYASSMVEHQASYKKGEESLDEALKNWAEFEPNASIVLGEMRFAMRNAKNDFIEARENYFQAMRELQIYMDVLGDGEPVEMDNMEEFITPVTVATNAMQVEAVSVNAMPAEVWAKWEQLAPTNRTDFGYEEVADVTTNFLKAATGNANGAEHWAGYFVYTAQPGLRGYGLKGALNHVERMSVWAKELTPQLEGVEVPKLFGRFPDAYSITDRKDINPLIGLLDFAASYEEDVIARGYDSIDQTADSEVAAARTRKKMTQVIAAIKMKDSGARARALEMLKTEIDEKGLGRTPDEWNDGLFLVKPFGDKLTGRDLKVEDSYGDRRVLANLYTYAVLHLMSQEEVTEYYNTLLPGLIDLAKDMIGDQLADLRNLPDGQSDYLNKLYTQLKRVPDAQRARWEGWIDAHEKMMRENITLDKALTILTIARENAELLQGQGIVTTARQEGEKIKYRAKVLEALSEVKGAPMNIDMYLSMLSTSIDEDSVKTGEREDIPRINLIPEGDENTSEVWTGGLDEKGKFDGRRILRYERRPDGSYIIRYDRYKKAYFVPSEEDVDQGIYLKIAQVQAKKHGGIAEAHHGPDGVWNKSVYGDGMQKEVIEGKYGENNDYSVRILGSDNPDENRIFVYRKGFLAEERDLKNRTIKTIGQESSTSPDVYSQLTTNKAVLVEAGIGANMAGRVFGYSRNNLELPLSEVDGAIIENGEYRADPSSSKGITVLSERSNIEKVLTDNPGLAPSNDTALVTALLYAQGENRFKTDSQDKKEVTLKSVVIKGAKFNNIIARYLGIATKQTGEKHPFELTDEDTANDFVWWTVQVLKGTIPKAEKKSDVYEGDVTRVIEKMIEMASWREVRNTAVFMATINSIDGKEEELVGKLYRMLYNLSREVVEGRLSDKKAKKRIAEELKIMREPIDLIYGPRGPQSSVTTETDDRLSAAGADKKTDAAPAVAPWIFSVLMASVIAKIRKGKKDTVKSEGKDGASARQGTGEESPEATGGDDAAADTPAVTPPAAPVTPVVSSVAPPSGPRAPRPADSADFFDRQITHSTKYLLGLQGRVTNAIKGTFGMEEIRTLWKRISSHWSNPGYEFTSTDQEKIADSIINTSEGIIKELDRADALARHIATLDNPSYASLQDMFVALSDRLNPDNEDSITSQVKLFNNRRRRDENTKNVGDRADDRARLQSLLSDMGNILTGIDGHYKSSGLTLPVLTELIDSIAWTDNVVAAREYPALEMLYTEYEAFQEKISKELGGKTIDFNKVTKIATDFDALIQSIVADVVKRAPALASGFATFQSDIHAFVANIGTYAADPTMDMGMKKKAVEGEVKGIGKEFRKINALNGSSQKEYTGLMQIFFFATAGNNTIEGLAVQQSFGAPGHFLNKPSLTKNLRTTLKIAIAEAMEVKEDRAHFEKYYIDRKQKFGYPGMSRVSLTIRSNDEGWVELEIPDDKGNVMWEGTTMRSVKGVYNNDNVVVEHASGSWLTRFEDMIPVIFGMTERLKTAAEIRTHIAANTGINSNLGDVVDRYCTPLRRARVDGYTTHTEHQGDDSSRQPVRERLGKSFLIISAIIAVSVFIFGAAIFPQLDFLPAAHEVIATGVQGAKGAFHWEIGGYFLSKFLVTMVFFTISVTMLQKKYLATHGMMNKGGLARVMDTDIGSAVPARRMESAVQHLRATGHPNFDGVETRNTAGSLRSSEDMVTDLTAPRGIRAAGRKVSEFLRKSEKPVNAIKDCQEAGAEPFFFVYLNSVTRADLVAALQRIETATPGTLPAGFQTFLNAQVANNYRPAPDVILVNNEDIVAQIENCGPAAAEAIYDGLRTDRDLFIHIARCTPLFGEAFMLEAVNVRNHNTDYPNLTVWPALVEHDQSVTDRFTELVSQGLIPDGTHALLSSQMGVQKQNLPELVGDERKGTQLLTSVDGRVKKGWDMKERFAETKSVATGYAISGMEIVAEHLRTSGQAREDDSILMTIPQSLQEAGAPEVFEILDAEDRANTHQPWAIAIGFQRINTIVEYLQEVVETEGYDAVKPRNLRRNHRELYDESMRWGVDLLLISQSLENFDEMSGKLAQASSNEYIKVQKDIFEESLLGKEKLEGLEGKAREDALKKAFVLSEMRARISPPVLQGTLRLNPLGDNPFTTQDYGPWNMLKRGLVAPRSGLTLIAAIITAVAVSTGAYAAVLALTGSQVIGWVAVFIAFSVGFDAGTWASNRWILANRHKWEWLEKSINKASPFPYDGTTNSFFLEKLVGRDMRTGERTFRGNLEHNLYELKRELYPLRDDVAAREAIDFMATFIPYKTLGIHDSNDIIEDAKLGSLCSKYGYRNMMIVDYGTETFEANLPELGYEWWYQRSRWITITPIAVMLRAMPDRLLFFGMLAGMGFGGAIGGSRMAGLLGLFQGFIGVAIGAVIGAALGYRLGLWISARRRAAGTLTYPEQEISFAKQAGPHNFLLLIFLLFGKPATLMTSFTFGTTLLLAVAGVFQEASVLGSVVAPLIQAASPLFWFISKTALGIALFFIPMYIIFEMSVKGALLSGPDDESLVEDGLDRMKETAEKFQNYRISRELKRISGMLLHSPGDRAAIDRQVDVLTGSNGQDGLLYSLSTAADTSGRRERKIFDFDERTTRLLEDVRSRRRSDDELRRMLDQQSRDRMKSLNKSLVPRVAAIEHIDTILDEYMLRGNYSFSDFDNRLKGLNPAALGVRGDQSVAFFDHTVNRFRESLSSAGPLGVPASTLTDAIDVFNSERQALDGAVEAMMTEMTYHYDDVTAGRIDFGTRTFWLSTIMLVAAGSLFSVNLITFGWFLGLSIPAAVLFILWTASKMGMRPVVGMMPYYYMRQAVISMQIAVLYFLHMIPAAKITVEQIWARRDNWWSRTSHDEREVLRYQVSGATQRREYMAQVRQNLKDMGENIKGDFKAKRKEYKPFEIRSIFDNKLVALSVFTVAAFSLAGLLRGALSFQAKDNVIIFLVVAVFILAWKTIMLRFDEVNKNKFVDPPIALWHAGTALAGLGGVSMLTKMWGASPGYLELLQLMGPEVLWLDVTLIAVGVLLVAISIFVPRDVRRNGLMDIYNKKALYVLILGGALYALVLVPGQRALLAERKMRFVDEHINEQTSLFYMLHSSSGSTFTPETATWLLSTGLTEDDKLDHVKRMTEIVREMKRRQAEGLTYEDLAQELIQAYKNCPYPTGISGLEGWIKDTAQTFALKAGVSSHTLDEREMIEYFRKTIALYSFDAVSTELRKQQLAKVVDFSERMGWLDDMSKEEKQVLASLIGFSEARRIGFLEDTADKKRMPITAEEVRANYDYLRLQIEAYRQFLVESKDPDANVKYVHMVGIAQDIIERAGLSKEWYLSNVNRRSCALHLYGKSYWTDLEKGSSGAKQGKSSEAVSPEYVTRNAQTNTIEAKIQVSSDRRSNVVGLDVKKMLGGRALAEDEQIVLTVAVPDEFITKDPMASLSIQGVWNDASGNWQHGPHQILFSDRPLVAGKTHIFNVTISPLPAVEGYNFGYYTDGDFNSDRDALEVAGVRIVIGNADTRQDTYGGTIVIKGHIRKAVVSDPLQIVSSPTSAEAFARNSGVNMGFSFHDVGKWGDHAHDGFSSTQGRKKLKTRLMKLAKSGYTNVRLQSLFGDGRAGLVFDEKGTFEGFDEYVEKDVKALFEVLEEVRKDYPSFRVMPVLFSFELADGKSTEGRFVIGERPELLNNDANRAKLVAELNGIFSRYWGSAGVYAWDIFNEPEISHNNKDAHDRSFLDIGHVKALVEDIAGSIKEQKALVTVGSFSRSEMMKNWYLSSVDILQYHWYDKNPYAQLDFPASWASQRRPVLVGEFGVRGTFPVEVKKGEWAKAAEMFRMKGMSGAFLWVDGHDYKPDTAKGMPTAEEYAEWLQAKALKEKLEQQQKEQEKEAQKKAIEKQQAQTKKQKRTAGVSRILPKRPLVSKKAFRGMVHMRGSHGFTIQELMYVVATVGLVSIVAVPVLGVAKAILLISAVAAAGVFGAGLFIAGKALKDSTVSIRVRDRLSDRTGSVMHTLLPVEALVVGTIVTVGINYGVWTALFWSSIGAIVSGVVVWTFDRLRRRHELEEESQLQQTIKEAGNMAEAFTGKKMYLDALVKMRKLMDRTHKLIKKDKRIRKKFKTIHHNVAMGHETAMDLLGFFKEYTVMQVMFRGKKWNMTNKGLQGDGAWGSLANDENRLAAAMDRGLHTFYMVEAGKDLIAGDLRYFANSLYSRHAQTEDTNETKPDLSLGRLKELLKWLGVQELDAKEKTALKMGMVLHDYGRLMEGEASINIETGRLDGPTGRFGLMHRDSGRYLAKGLLDALKASELDKEIVLFLVKHHATLWELYSEKYGTEFMSDNTAENLSSDLSALMDSLDRKGLLESPVLPEDVARQSMAEKILAMLAVTGIADVYASGDRYLSNNFLDKVEQVVNEMTPAFRAPEGSRKDGIVPDGTVSRQGDGENDPGTGVGMSKGKETKKVIPGVEIALGMSEDTYVALKKQGDAEGRDIIAGLMKKTGVDMIVPLTSLDREDMLEEMQEKTKGMDTICAILDTGAINVANGIVDVNELEDIMVKFVSTSRKDILRLMNPRLSALNEKTVQEIQDVSQLKKVARIYARLWNDVETLDLVSKSIYDMRINNRNNDVLSGVSVSDNVTRYLTDGPKDKEAKFVSVSAKNAADMRFIASTLRAMGMDKKQASGRIQVRLSDANATKANLKDLMKATGLDKYLSTDNVKIVSGEMTLEETLEVVKGTFEITDASEVAIGDSVDLIKTDKDRELMSAEKAPVYVQMDGDGIASQLLLTVLEIVANDGKVPAALGQISTKDGYTNWYVYLPNMEKIDLDDLKNEIKNYERILIAA
ncbi:MAG: hypothetical protein P9L88_04540 [Candidatus Tantalella remota]|nr:hypothetical protein [Candidatus Tantalella remota]